MKTLVAIDRDVYVPWFEELDRQLAIRNKNKGFNTSSGKIRRDLVADEFMYMHHHGEPATEVFFKHRNTRNYLYLRKVEDSWTLIVPETSANWMLGKFDN